MARRSTTSTRPSANTTNPDFYADRAAGWGMKAVGRLKPGVPFAVARQDMDHVSRELTAKYPTVDSNEKANLVPLKDAMVGDMRGPLLVLLGAVFFVLLISCVNVSNLLLARSTAREREFAIRIAVGGGQWRIIRQLLTESILLALVGGIGGPAARSVRNSSGSGRRPAYAASRRRNWS